MRRKIIFSGIICLVFSVFAAEMPSAQAKEEPAQEQPIEVTTEGKGQGGLVTMDFEDADIRDVIKVIAIASGLNMIIGKDVEAKVTLSLKEVPWEKALDIILRTYNFTYKREENLIRIMTFEKVKQEERDIPLSTKIIYLNFADVSKLKGTLVKMLSERGSIETDTRTNSMLISDIPARLEEVERVAKKLDTRTPQVLIEAMLVDVKLTADDELGINWQILHVDRHDSWQDKTSSSNYIDQPTAMSSISGPALRLGFLQRMGSFRLDGLIQAWAQDAKANILASPKIMTLDNQTAKIEIKSQVAYTQYSESTEGGSTTSTQFKDVITGLEVTPHITKEGFISMNVKPRQEFVEATVNGQPQIGSRSAETNVLVKDGETIVIGGLRKVEDNTTVTKIPILGDIPLLGVLFRKNDLQKINTELVMFVTPHIIVQPELNDEEMDKFQLLDDARSDLLKKMEEEREKRLKKRKKQALLIEPLAEAVPVSSQEQEVVKEPPALPAMEKEDYIYSW